MPKCYNRTCGQDFDPASNSDDACLYHPGEPIFHEGIKKWSCCNKSSVDFTVFLDFPGCTRGRHNSTPLPKPETPKIEEKEVTIPKSIVPVERPSLDEPTIPLKMIVRDSLNQCLQKRMEELNLQQNETDETSEIVVGTPCANACCGKVYEGESSNKENCKYHSGTAVFHEGMKYWSCCEIKTTDFSSFLNQPGCKTGKHLWKKKTVDGKACRFDWHQTGSTVTLTIYAKLVVPKESYVVVNQVTCDIYLKYDAGKFAFEKKLVLCGYQLEVVINGTLKQSLRGQSKNQ
eukprot:XP_014772117.1 PREDICTED: cysteine and histidine-rich domain-containing protein 1-like [Octopus bimaculoides]